MLKTFFLLKNAIRIKIKKNIYIKILDTVILLKWIKMKFKDVNKTIPIKQDTIKSIIESEKILFLFPNIIRPTRANRAIKTSTEICNNIPIPNKVKMILFRINNVRYTPLSIQKFTKFNDLMPRLHAST